MDNPLDRPVANSKAVRPDDGIELLVPVMSEDLAVREFPPIKWAVPDLIPEGVTFLAGKPKMGKSWMALNIACAVADGGVALSKIEVSQGEVLYLAMEDNQRRLKTRLNKVSADSIPKGIHFFTEWRRLDELGIEYLDRYIDKKPEIRLVIIDTLAKIKQRGKGGPQYNEDYDAVGELHRIAHRYGVAILIIHHLKKQTTDDPMDQISGTLGLTGAADGMLVLARDRGKADAILHVTGRDIEEDGEYALEWDVDTALWVLVGMAEDVNRERSRQEIIDLLRKHPDGLTSKQIADALDRKLGTVKKQLQRMGGDGEVKPEGGNRREGYVYILSPLLNPVSTVPTVPASKDSRDGRDGNTRGAALIPWRYRLVDRPTLSTARLESTTADAALRELEKQFGRGQVMAVEPIGGAV